MPGVRGRGRAGDTRQQRDRGKKRRATTGAGFLAISLILAACGGSTSPSPAAPSASPSAAPSASASVAIPESPVEGLIVNIDGDGLTQVNSITVRTPEGTDHVFRVGQLEVPVPPAHLNEHMAGALPVRVAFRVEGGELVAFRIDDA